MEIVRCRGDQAAHAGCLIYKSKLPVTIRIKPDISCLAVENAALVITSLYGFRIKDS